MAGPKTAQHVLSAERVTFIGKADDGEYAIARTNGAGGEIRHVENVGACDVIIKCLGKTGGPFPAFNETLAPGEQLGAFLAPQSSTQTATGRPLFFIAFEGKNTNGTNATECKIEVDRRAVTFI